MQPKVHIYNINNNHRHNIWHFNKSAKEMINSEDIFIDHLGMRIRLPDFDDNRTYKLHTQNNRYDATCGGANLTDSDISGEYELEKDGDWFLLNRIVLS